MSVEPILRNKKKAEMIKKDLGAITTLEQAATKLGKQVEVADSLTMNGNNMVIGYEPKVIGAAFNPNSRGKIVPEAIEGSNGVYVVRVETVTATAQTGMPIAEKRKAMIAQAKQRLAYPLQAVREGANIKDNRSKFY